MSAALAPLTAQRVENLQQAPVANSDETGLAVNGKLMWVHAFVSIEDVQLYLSDFRGRKAMGHLLEFTNILVHDGWLSYHNFGTYVNALCNAHHLRELEFLETVRKLDWARLLKELLQEAYWTVETAKKEGKSSLPELVLTQFRERFLELLDLSESLVPPPETWPSNRWRKPKRPKELRLISRLRRNIDAVFRFATNFAVPFDNNLAERSIRMLKVFQKIIGCFRTESGARDHLTIRSAFMSAIAKGESVLSLFRLHYAMWREGRAWAE